MSRNTAEIESQQVRTTNLTESERHSLLSSERRRVVLDILENQATRIELAELASEVTKQEAVLDTVDSATAERVKITLHHIHLPKMDELGILTYEPESQLVRV